MFETIKENIAKASSYFGDFLENPRATTVRLFNDVTLGSVPNRSDCDCDEEAKFCKKLHDLQITGVCRREA